MEVKYQKKDLENLLGQVVVCHKEGVLFNPQIQKSFVSGYHHAILICSAAAYLDSGVRGIEHALEAFCALPGVCTGRI